MNRINLIAYNSLDDYEYELDILSKVLSSKDINFDLVKKILNLTSKIDFTFIISCDNIDVKYLLLEQIHDYLFISKNSFMFTLNINQLCDFLHKNYESKNEKIKDISYQMIDNCIKVSPNIFNYIKAKYLINSYINKCRNKQKIRKI